MCLLTLHSWSARLIKHWAITIRHACGSFISHPRGVHLVYVTPKDTFIPPGFGQRIRQRGFDDKLDSGTVAPCKTVHSSIAKCILQCMVMGIHV